MFSNLKLQTHGVFSVSFSLSWWRSSFENHLQVSTIHLFYVCEYMCKSCSNLKSHRTCQYKYDVTDQWTRKFDFFFDWVHRIYVCIRDNAKCFDMYDIRLNYCCFDFVPFLSLTFSFFFLLVSTAKKKALFKQRKGCQAKSTFGKCIEGQSGK